VEVWRAAWSDLTPASGRWAVTLGSFDGLHRGHQAILRSCRRIARAEGLAGAVAVSFVRHPRSQLPGQRPPRLLSSLPERLALLAECGIERVVLLPFTPELAAMSHVDFVQQVLLAKLAMAHFVLGHDVHFGHERGGNAHSVGDLAEASGFGVSQVPSVRADGRAISSSRIRDLVAAGEIAAANQLLGHPHLLSGSVQPGRQLGRQLGFPTANLAVEDPAKLLPATGVYAAWARAEGDWERAVVHVGPAPSVSPEPQIRVEAHLLDGEHELYGKLLCLALVARLREVRSFADLERLRGQIERDVAAAGAALAAFAAPAKSLQVSAWQAFAQQSQA
jgi:riboflavin kinase/FMN adenylyltransferase